jgi:periplasmic divalent cation tolerance protein
VTDVRVIYSTAPDVDTAARIARSLVDERLAACGNILPGVRSIYRWQGIVEDEPEVVLILKTRADRVDALTRRLAELHPYDVPDVVALPVDAGHGPYLDWVRENVR